MCLCASRNLQRLCSNPGKPPETLGKRIIDKYVYLQELCKPRKPLGAAAKSAATIGSQVHALPTTLREASAPHGTHTAHVMPNARTKKVVKGWRRIN
jgi:hypothetical protein